MATKKTARRPITKKSDSPTPTKIVAGSKFGYRLVKSVSGRNVTYVNTNGCAPSTAPKTSHTVSIAEFKELVGL